MRDVRGVVLDASAAVELLVGTARAQLVRAELTGRHVFVPGLFDAEVLNALKGLERAGGTPAAIDEARRHLLTFPAVRVPLDQLSDSAWKLRHQLSMYDAFYVALARELECPVLTRDGRWDAAGRLGISVLHVS